MALAVERGGEDNVTVVLVDVEDGPAAEPEAASAVGATAVAEKPSAPGGDGPAAPRGTTQVIARAEARATADTPPQKITPAAARKPFPWVRLAVGAGVLVLLVIATWVGVRLYVDRQWYVGVEDGKTYGKKGFVIVAHVPPQQKTEMPSSLSFSTGDGEVEIPVVVERSEPFKPE